ncbi:hypothetical protein FKW77_008744 [Venturia effusa]|uniref:Uncharacterized protein n=1 Tax=Venturia effusa TaxID=50376 RepID=A0A517LJF3_9PEZI|nr:hypothetical protein FKW77_008744 [Venturia effusa]
MIECSNSSIMAKRRGVSSAILCSLIFLFALVVLHLYSTTGEVVPHSVTSTTIKVTDPISLAVSHDTIPSNDSGSIPQASIQGGRHELRSHVYRRDVLDDYAKAVGKGHEFFCFMGRSKKGAQAWIDSTPGLQKYPLESAFNDPAEIDKWGWEVVNDGHDLLASGSIKAYLYKLMKDMKVLNPETPESWAVYQWRHLKPWSVVRDPGSTLPSSGPRLFRAFYQNYFTKDKGNIAIVIDMMFSPQGVVKQGVPGPPPDLGRTSDMLFLQYYKHGQEFYDFPPPLPVSRIPAPRHIFIQNIVTPAVKAMFARLAELDGTPPPGGQQYFPDSEEGMMLMGTAHGMSVGWFLIQHKDHFGNMGVISIRIWLSGVQWSLYFEIGEVEMEDDQAGDAVARARRRAALLR